MMSALFSEIGGARFLTIHLGGKERGTERFAKKSRIDGTSSILGRKIGKEDLEYNGGNEKL